VIIIGVLVVGLLISTGVALGVIANQRFQKNKGEFYGQAFSTAGLILGIFAIAIILLLPPPTRRHQFYSIMCGSNLANFGKIMILYANDNNEKYPIANEWCDIIAKNEEVPAKSFICPGAVLNGDKGRCHYAMNPNCEPNSPPDTVLLFETKSGWNQHGGPELLSIDNHYKRKGANILFNDGHVKFIESDEVNKLKWKADANQPASQ
jgi:prepilin-type processing-associated H-X9-DG protein